MKVNDRIRTNGKTSPSTTGKIVAIFDGHVYRKLFVHPQYSMDVWNKVNADWQNELVYMVEKDFAEIPLFKDDILKLKEEGYDMEKEYGQVKQVLAYYPACEVEECDWIDDVEKALSDEQT